MEIVCLTDNHEVMYASKIIKIDNCDVLQVVDAETGTRQLAAGEDGELCVRGGSVMRGYLNNDKATHETIDSDGWLHTGYLFICNGDCDWLNSCMDISYWLFKILRSNFYWLMDEKDNY